MEINTKFKRGLEHNYIVATGIEIENDDYQVMMLKHNRIPGLLQFEIKNNNGDMEFYYEVSSMQPIKRIYENNLIDYEGLKKILSGIYFSIKSATGYLLDENDLVLDPEYIYMCVEGYKLELMHYPAYQGNINKEFIKFAEFILDRVDHQSSMAVMLAYNIFKVVRMQTFTIDDLVKLIEVSDNSRESDNDNSKEYHSNNAKEKTNANTYNKDTEELDKVINDEIKNDIKKEELVSKKKKSSGLFKNIFFKSKKQEKNEILEKIMNSDDYDDYEMPVYTEDSSEKEYGKTTLLVPENEENKTAIIKTKHYLKDVNTERIYEINDYPATIGKVYGMASVVIDSPGISRMHAQISYKNGKYYLCDIGSSNGTYLNGLLIEDDIQLEDDDEIIFGNVHMLWK